MRRVERDVRPVIAAIAFLASLVAFLVVAGTGIFLLAVENSGERLAGAVLALAATLAFAAAAALVFAPRSTFRPRRGRALAAVLTLLAVAPVAVLAFLAFRFAGVPLDSAVPLLDWGVFGLAVLFACGAGAIVFLGSDRLRRPRREPPPIEGLGAAQRQLHAALQQDRDIRMRAGAEDDVRVTLV
jgi:hypothetical protein